MEIQILEDTKRHLSFSLKDVGHTFSNLLVYELRQNPDVQVASYTVDHPLTGVPIFIVDTNTKTSPKSAIANALKNIKKANDKLAKSLPKAVK